MDAAWEEVERMAAAASANDAEFADDYPAPEVIERWQRLFGYSHSEAVSLISAQRDDVTRERITDEYWSLVKDSKEALGYDREAYEHSLSLPDVFKGQSATIPITGNDGEMVLLFRLGGLLDTPEKVKEIAGLNEVPVVKEGLGEMGKVKLCVVDKDAQKKLEEWLVRQSVLGK